MIGDVDIRNRWEKVHLSQNQRRQPIGKGPQEYEHGTRQITWRAKRQGDGEKSPKAAGSLDFGGFFKGGVDVGETGRKTQDDKREHMQGLNEYQPMINHR